MKKIIALTLVSFTLLACSPSEYEMPNGFKTQYDSIGGRGSNAEDVSYSNINRYSSYIKVPMNLSKESIINNVKYSVNIYRKLKKTVNGLLVFVYADFAPQDGAYTVARCTYAPNGDWSKITSSSGFSTNTVKCDFNEGYFNFKLPKKGEKITIMNSTVFRNEKGEKTYESGTEFEIESVTIGEWSGNKEINIKISKDGYAAIVNYGKTLRFFEDFM